MESTLNLGIKTLNRNGAIVVIGLFGQERKSNGVELSKSFLLSLIFM